MNILQPRNLVGQRANKFGQQSELRIELLVGFMKRLQEDRIFGQKESANSGLFIHHEFEEAVGMRDHEVGMIDQTCAPLDILQANAEDKGEEGEGGNGQREEADQK